MFEDSGAKTYWAEMKMRQWLRTGNSQDTKRIVKTQNSKSTRISHRRLCCEQLEDRVLLNADAQFYHVVFSPTSSPADASQTGVYIASDIAGDSTQEISAANATGNDDQVITPLSASSPRGMTPQQIRTAYGINLLTGDGTGQTIAIVDAYDDPRLVSSTDANYLNSDLHLFDVQFGLADPGSFYKVNQTGGATYATASGSSNWALETALDVEWAHAIAPGANILLVEANSPSYDDMMAAVDYARHATGVVAVSMSWGSSEFASEQGYDSYFTTPTGHTGVTFLASTGDGGSPGGFPAFSSNVIAVGGTTLTVNGNTYVSETAWSGSGGGKSIYESEPSYQNWAQSSGWRQTPDVSFDANPNTGVAVYDSYDYGSSTPWVQVGGTSLSAPCWAGLIAIADELRVSQGLSSLDGRSQTLSQIYSLPSADFHDIISGNNGSFSAGIGYDEVTGRGSPLANLLVPDLAFFRAPDLTVNVTHSASFKQGDTSDTYTITVTNSGNGSTTGAVSLVDSLPAGLTATAFSGDGWTVNLATLTATRSDSLAAGCSYSALTLTVGVATDAPAIVTNTVKVSGGGEVITANDTANDLTTVAQLVDMTVTTTHAGNFKQGDVGDKYTITVTNLGTLASSGTVSLVDLLPTGLTATAFSGTGWTTDLLTLTATRSDSLAAGASYAPLILTVNVAANAPQSVTNKTTVSGGGETNTTNNTASDDTIITPVSDLVVASVHSGDFKQGDVGDVYTITVTNIGSSATIGTVRLVDLLPVGMTATSFTGQGWTTDLSTLTATRNNSLAAGDSYSPLTLTVNVAANASASVVNKVTVSGGGEKNTANDSASDPTTINSSVAGLPTVAGTMPQLTGGTLPVDATTLAVYFNQVVVGGGTAANYELRSVGDDGLLGTADDAILPLSASYTGITATLGFGSLTPGIYRLTVRDAITDAAGHKLDGNGDGIAGGNFVTDFVVNSAATGSLLGVPTTIAVGGATAMTSLATGDFNGDGETDIVTSSEDVVSVLLGNGLGGFSIATQFTPSICLSGVAVGDFNGDGKLDIVTGQYGGTASLFVSFGDGHGGFSRTVNLNLNANYTCYGDMAVADFNRDGKLDIATANYGSTTVMVVLGTGQGTFSSPIFLDSGGSLPESVATGDFNGDGKLDLAVTHWNTTTGVTVLLGDGTGSFSAPTTALAGLASDSLAIADFNADGKVDIAVADTGNRRVDILLGNGAGGFAAPRVFSTGGISPIYAESLSTADFNGDGILDLVVADYFSNTISMLLGDGAGNFASPVLFDSGGTSANTLALADFNNDGRCDLAVANVRSTLGVLLNTSVASPVVLTSPNNYSFDVTAGGWGAGQLVQGTNNAFDGLNRLQVDGSSYAPASGNFNLADGNQTILLPAVTMSGLTVSREITVPNTGSQDFVRTIDVFQNTTDATITTTVRIVGNLGSNGNTTVFATSDGDSVVEPTDQWIGFDDGVDGAGTPAIIQYIHGSNGLQPTSTIVTGDNVEWTYNLVVPAGATVRLAHFTIQNSTEAGALAAANTLVTDRGFGGQATVFLSPSEVQSIANFDAAPPTVASTSPSISSGSLIAGNHSLQVVFDEPVVGADTQANYELRGLGLDGLLGTADDTIVPISVNYTDNTATLNFASLTEGIYRLTIRDAITDVADKQLDGACDGVAGADFVRDFVVVSPATSALFGTATVTNAKGSTVSSVAAADFNGDGKADIAFTNGNESYVYAMVGNGKGGFSSTIKCFTGGVDPSFVTTCDCDADGNVDLVTGNNGLIGFQFGTGNGTFTQGNVFLGGGNGSSPLFVVAGDFNGDGNLDFATDDNATNHVTVFFGDGYGSFPGNYKTVPVGGLPSSLATGDFNGDGKLDLVATIPAANSVAIMLGNGDGTFGSPTLLSSGGSSPKAMTVGDFNGDGHLDLAVVNSGSNNIAVLLGNGAGGFVSPVLFDTGGTSPQQIVAADFNGDSRLDLAVTDSVRGSVGILLGNGAGGFASATTYSSGGTGPSAISVGDFNGDGRPDLVIGNATSDTVAVLLNTAQPLVSLTSPNGYVFDVLPTGSGAGQLVQGTNNAFDGLNRLQVGNTSYATASGTATLADGGRTVILPSETLAGLTVSREITVPSTGSQDFARTLDVFTNSTASTISTTVEIVGNLGSDAATTVFATSDGDTTVEASDQWIGTDGGEDGGTPAVIHYIHGPAGLQPSSVEVIGDNIVWTYNLTVSAGQTVRLASFTIVGQDRADAVAAANALVTSSKFGGQAASFLTQTELASIGNFVFDQTPPTSAINCPANGISYNATGWPDSISGTSYDSNTGVSQVQVSVRRLSDGMYWGGTSFNQSSEFFIAATGTTSWSVSFLHANLPASGSYAIHARGTDAAGNVEAGPTVTFIYDTIIPTVTAANITIGGATGTGGAYRVGDTVTAVWNNTAGGDNNTDIAGVIMDFSQFGGGSVKATNNLNFWTASYTISAGTIDAANRNVSVWALDIAGNTKTTLDNANVKVDNVKPRVTAANIAIRGATGTAGVYRVGDTITVTWNNTTSGDNNADIAAVTVDFSQFGGGAAVNATNNSNTWTASYMIAAGTTEATNLNVVATVADDAGNVTRTPYTANLSLDNKPSTVISSTPSTAGPISTNSLTFTVVFDETVSNVTADDFQLTATGTAKGTVAGVDASNGTSFTVTVNTIWGDGALRLDLKAGTDVQDATGNIALAFTGGETVTVVSTSVVGQHIFYNNSAWDGNNAAANTTDDSAIATDKSALLPGNTATFANYTSYSRGINGIMVDIAGLYDRKLTANDFEFRFGNTADPTTWSIVTSPATIAAPRAIAGSDGTRRVEITWPDGALKNGWLQVTVKATANTGLVSPEVFYFGNAVGETGNQTTVAAVTVADVARIRQQSGNSGLSITNLFDINRNGSVTVADVGLCQQNSGFNLYMLSAPASLLATVGESQGDSVATTLSMTQVQGAVDAAPTRGKEVGVSDEILNKMKTVQLVVSDLPSSNLGMAYSNQIVIDRDAAGHGRLTTPTPMVDEEFRQGDSASGLRGIAPTVPDRIDLLSVVSHELGHIAGLDDLASLQASLMNSSLRTGSRLVPSALEVDFVFSSSLNWWNDFDR